MNRWFHFERNWGLALLGAMIPGDLNRPGLAACDLKAFWKEFEAKAPTLLRLGFRASIWILTTLAWTKSLRTFEKLPQSQQDALLNSWGRSRWYLLRQLVLTVKLIACFAYFTPDAARPSFTGLPWK